MANSGPRTDNAGGTSPWTGSNYRRMGWILLPRSHWLLNFLAVHQKKYLGQVLLDPMYIQITNQILYPCATSSYDLEMGV
jgi:hypothetical protein